MGKGKQDRYVPLPFDAATATRSLAHPSLTAVAVSGTYAAIAKPLRLTLA